MSNKVSNKLSYFAVTFIMGAIIVSFVLTGFEGFNNNVGQVASVGGTPVTSAEYNRAYQFSLDQYARMMQGKSLTNQQIRQFNIRENTLNQLISQKHMVNFANDLDFDAGKKYIKDEIKEYKMFQSGGQFDINKYKQLLQANRLSPAKFEEEMADQIKTRKLSQLLSSIRDSKAYTKKATTLRNTKLKSTIVSIDKEAMTKNLTITNKKVGEFVKDEKNKNLLESLYKTYEAEFKAKNPKKKVKSLKSVQNELAKKHLQKTDREALTAFNTQLEKDISDMLTKNQIKKLERLGKKYGFSVDKNVELTLLNPVYKGQKFDGKEVQNIVKTNNINNILKTSTAIKLALLKPNKIETKAATEADTLKEIKFSGNKNARFLQREVLNHQQETTKVTTSLPVL